MYPLCIAGKLQIAYRKDSPDSKRKPGFLLKESLQCAVQALGVSFLFFAGRDGMGEVIVGHFPR